MPGPGTLFTLGAVGAAGAAAMFNRRNSSGGEQENGTNMTPHELGRRRSSADSDLSFSESRKMVRHFKKCLNVLATENGEWNTDTITLGIFFFLFFIARVNITGGATMEPTSAITLPDSSLGTPT